MARQVVVLSRHMLRRGNRIGRPTPPRLVELGCEQYVHAPTAPVLCELIPSNDRLRDVAVTAIARKPGTGN